MKKATRKLSLLTALILVAQTVAACGSSSTQSNETTAGSNDTTAPLETTAPPLTDNLPDVKFDGEEINILAAVEQWKGDYFFEEASGDVLSDAVYERNQRVQERFDVKLNYNIHNGYAAGTAAVSAALSGAVMSGDGSIDIYLANSAYVSGPFLGDMFVNLNDREYLDFSKPWWLSEANDQMVINGKLYLAAGTWGLNTLTRSWVVYFDKSVAEEFKLPNLYEEVKNGSWTIDKMLEYARPVYSDLNGNGEADDADRYGILATKHEAVYALSFGMNRRVTRQVDGLPELIPVNEHMETIYEKLRGMYLDERVYFGGNDSNPANKIIPMLNENRGLFAVYLLRIVSEGMRELDDFGILPLPKFDEDQEKYMSQVSMDVYGIPKGVSAENIERNTILLEALCSDNYLNVIPVYKDIALDRKYTRDTESAEMIDLVLDGVFTDFGLLFHDKLDANFLYLGKIMESYDSYSRWWAERELSMNTKIEEYISQITAFED